MPVGGPSLALRCTIVLVTLGFTHKPELCADTLVVVCDGKNSQTHARVFKKKGLRCRSWWSRVPWRCDRLPPAPHLSGQPKCWCRPPRHRSASVLLSGGQGLSTGAAGPTWHPWKGADSNGAVRPSVCHCSSREEWGCATSQQVGEQCPGDERDKSRLLNANTGFLTGSPTGKKWPPADTISESKPQTESTNKQHNASQFAYCPLTTLRGGKKNIFTNVQRIKSRTNFLISSNCNVW